MRTMAATVVLSFVLPTALSGLVTQVRSARYHEQPGPLSIPLGPPRRVSGETPENNSTTRSADDFTPAVDPQRNQDERYGRLQTAEPGAGDDDSDGFAGPRVPAIFHVHPSAMTGHRRHVEHPNVVYDGPRNWPDTDDTDDHQLSEYPTANDNTVPTMWNRYANLFISKVLNYFLKSILIALSSGLKL